MPYASAVLGINVSAQVIDRAEAELRYEVGEAALEEVSLAVVKHDAHLGIDTLLKKAIVLRVDVRDDCLPSHGVTS
jgi:hypothetical protein